MMSIPNLKTQTMFRFLSRTFIMSKTIKSENKKQFQFFSKPFKMSLSKESRQLEFTTSSKLGKQLVLENHVFNKDKTRANGNLH